MRRAQITHILKIAALTGVGAVVLLLVCLLLLPTFVNSPPVQNKIKQSLSSSLKRQIDWSRLAFSWSDGVTLSALHLGEGSAPLLKADIEQIRIIPAVVRTAGGRFGVDLAVRVHNIRAELAPGPAKPPVSPAKDPLTQVAELIQRLQAVDLSLPVDLRVTLDVAPVQIGYRLPGRTLRLDDGTLRLDMPSLAARPVSAAVSGRVSVNGRKTGAVQLRATVSDLAAGAGRIRMAPALFNVTASAPGVGMSLSGGLDRADGFTGRVNLDLPALLAVAGPLLPPQTPLLSGHVALLLKARSDAERNLHAAVTVDGTGLAASGGSFKTKQVGPLDLKLVQQIVTDRLRQRVAFPGGTINVPGLATAAWSAAVTNPSAPGRRLELNFGPLRLDLARARGLSAPFIPANSPLTDISGELLLRSLVLHLAGPGNSGDLALAGFGVTLPHLRLALKQGEFVADGVELRLEKAECPLTAGLPTRVTSDLLWSINSAVLSGAQPLAVRGGRGTAGLVITDLTLKSLSPRSFTASASVTQTLDLARASLGTAVVADKVHQQLRLLVRAPLNGTIEADLPEFSLAVGSLRGAAAGKQISPLPLTATLTAAGFRLPPGTDARPLLQRAAATVAAGDFLQLAASGSLSGTTVTTGGSARLDLRRLMPWGAPLLPPGVTADGIAGAAWNLAGPLPGRSSSLGMTPLRAARKGLSLFDKCELAVTLDSVSATLPSARGAIRVSGVRTGPDLRFAATNNGESLRIGGGVQFSGVQGGTAPPQHGTFTLNGELTGWRDLHVSQMLKLAPLNFSQEAELNVSHIDLLLDEKTPFSSATLLKRLDATLFASVDGTFSREQKQLVPGVDVAGVIKSGARMELSGGRELALRGFLNSRDFDVQLAGGTKIEGMRSAIEINRVYALSAPQGESWTPLSMALVRPAGGAAANPGGADILGRINSDLRGVVRGGRSFSIRRVTTKVSGVSLELSALEGDLLLTGEKSGISFFQADLLGGTLLAHALLDLRPEIPVAAASGSFSHLDLSWLVPKESGKRQAGQDAEITGEIGLTAPLTPEQRDLFEQLRLTLNLRKIGADTIERALFSLDPYERNEQLVAQRKMLRLGRLKGLRAAAVDGAFSMEGEAEIKGVAVDLPKVERVRISELPLRRELVANRKGIMALRGFLDLLRADSLVVGPKGELSFKRRMYVQ